ncbi:hypothetical protein Dimus_012057 [Dionaea muscipula]
MGQGPYRRPIWACISPNLVGSVAVEAVAYWSHAYRSSTVGSRHLRRLNRSWVVEQLSPTPVTAAALTSAAYQDRQRMSSDERRLPEPVTVVSSSLDATAALFSVCWVRGRGE